VRTKSRRTVSAATPELVERQGLAALEPRRLGLLGFALLACRLSVALLTGLVHQIHVAHGLRAQSSPTKIIDQPFLDSPGEQPASSPRTPGDNLTGSVRSSHENPALQATPPTGRGMI